MVVGRERFELALERLQSGDWQKFENLCSAFLAPEFPNLRTTASPSGDRGADAVLYNPDGDPTVVIQYSIRADWPKKIAQTADRIKTEFPQATTLVYLTNQKIAAASDSLTAKLRWQCPLRCWN